jgi:hypothetical protein
LSRASTSSSKNAAVAVAAIVIVFAAGFVGYQWLARQLNPIDWIISLFDSSKHREPSQPPIQPPNATPSALRWDVEAQGDSMSADLTSVDGFSEAPAGTYRSRQPLHTGDRFRFHVTQHQGWVALLFRNGDALQRINDSGGTPATFPDGDNWIRLDSNPGVEQFVLVSSRDAIASVANWPDGKPFTEVLSELSGLQQSPDVRVARIEIVHQ